MKISKKLKSPQMIALIATTLIMLPIFNYTYQENKVENVQEMLKNNGYKDIVVGSYAITCGRHYTVQRNFSATNNSGDKVEGKICAKSLYTSILGLNEPDIRVSKMSR